MYRSNLLNLTGDPALPDLLPEEPLLDDLFHLNDPTVAITHPDIVALNQRLDHLSLETNTQGLRIGVERAKRQKLRTTIRQVRQDMLLICPDIMSVRNDIETMRGSQNAVNYQLDGEITRLNTLTFRCLSRMDQIIALLLPYVTMPSDSSYELHQMLQELARTIQQFSMNYAASHV